MTLRVPILVCAALTVLHGACPGAAAAGPAKKPNILVVLADDLGPGDLGCYGGRIAATPNLDRLAQGGTRFTQYYAASPICSPSRAGLLTGCFPARWKITSYLQTRAGNRGCGQADFLDAQAPSLPRLLRAIGYRTVHIGKWHLGGGRDVKDAPKFAAYGYDEHVGTYESPEPEPAITATDWIWSNKDPVKRWERTAFFVDRTLDFLKRHRGTPCFVNLWLDDPHTPWVPSANAPKGDRQANLKAVLEEMDHQIGRLMKGLQDLGIAEDTLVIFLSDNGPLPTFAGARAVGLRGSKLSLYEGGLRLPCIVHGPGRVTAQRVDDTTVLCGIDFLPTLASLAGAALPAGAPCDGEDRSPALRGTAQKSRQRPLFWEYGRNEKYFSYPSGKDRSPNLAMREGPWKLLVNDDGSRTELYDLSTDPHETANRAAAEPARAQRMRETLLAWRKSLP
jgi:arylsulfatase A-like enzyme